MITSRVLERDVLVAACAISAGVHAALVPDHLAESTGLGVGFVVAVVALAVVVIGLTRRPASALPVAGAGVVLGGLIAGYVLVTTTGLPLLHPDAEPVDGLGLATKAIEVVGLLVSAHLLSSGRTALGPARLRPKGTRT